MYRPLEIVSLIMVEARVNTAGLSYDTAADLIATVGRPAFSESLMRASRAMIDADYCTLFAFSDARDPMCLVATGIESPNAAVRASQHYLDGHWRSDPLLHMPKLDEHAVHHVFSSEITDIYRRDCYDIPRIRDRLTLLFREGPTIFRMSFYRYLKRSCFDDGDTSLLNEAERLLHESAKRHFSLSNQHGVDPRTGRPSLSLMKERLEMDAGLSPREVEVCGRILLGMTAEGIASDLNLGITSVLTYRKRAYAKLEVTSRNELFARYLVN